MTPLASKAKERAAALEWGMLSDATLIGCVLAVGVYLWVVQPARWFRNGRKGHFPLPWI